MSCSPIYNICLLNYLTFGIGFLIGGLVVFYNKLNKLKRKE